MVVIEPDKPHSFEVTIPSFNVIVTIFDKIGEVAEDITKDFVIVPVDGYENMGEMEIKK